jgi:hypothetical protein
MKLGRCTVAHLQLAQTLRICGALLSFPETASWGGLPGH